MPYCEVFCRFPGCSHNISVEHEDGVEGVTNAHAQMRKHEKAEHVCATCGYCPPHRDDRYLWMDAAPWTTYMDKHKQTCQERRKQPPRKVKHTVAGFYIYV